MSGTAGAAKGAAKKRSRQAAAGESAAVIDDLFASIPKRAAREAPAEPVEAAVSKPKRSAAVAAAGKPAADGERRSRQQDYYLDTGEKIVAVR